ncbi:Interleukin-22 [Myotis brandtii]|uniref:Interleukin-22 n=1 Tax=Myotis brandtii TaxID=109478 RepID=S7MD98_MYOBR|nr:PREDICTED: interleukin-22 [Myotis brandtii]EPQ01656.1 Interleukin-22 [Myotis brandtii]
MATLQKSVSFSLMGTLAASCLFLIALSVQGGAAVPIRSYCKLNESNFLEDYFTNRTYRMAEEFSLVDNNTDVRLIEDKLYDGVNMNERCYVMKQVLDFTLKEVLFPEFDRFQPYMKEVVSFLDNFNKKLSQCHIEGDDQHIQRNVQKLKDTVKELGESGKIKAIGEVNLLLDFLRKACICYGKAEQWKMTLFACGK